DFGWDAGRFGVRVTGAGAAAGGDAGADPLAATFDGPVVPEATPNPRTIRFGFGHPIHAGPSRWYESATAAADDPPVARLVADFAGSSWPGGTSAACGPPTRGTSPPSWPPLRTTTSPAGRSRPTSSGRPTPSSLSTGGPPSSPTPPVRYVGPRSTPWSTPAGK